MKPKEPSKAATPTEAIKRKANDLRKTLAQLDKITGQNFTVTRRADVAKFFDVSVQAVDKWIGAGMPGTRNAYDLHKIIVWLRSEGPWRPLGGGRGTAEDIAEDPVESEWSEEYRKWKARIAELEYNQRIGQLMSVEMFRDVTISAFNEVRQFAERQIKAHGNGTAVDWAETIARFERTLEGAIGQPCDSDGTQSIPVDGGPAAPAVAAEPDGVGREENQDPDRAACGSDVPT